jgi:hypothetical protein
MYRAVSKQPIHVEDFLRTSNLPAHVDKYSTQFSAFHGPNSNVPSALEGNDDGEEEVDESGKLHPVNIAQLKEFMQKKIQKTLVKKNVKGQIGAAFYIENREVSSA